MIIGVSTVGFIGWNTAAVGDTSIVTTKVRIDKLITSTPAPNEDEVLVPLHKAQALKAEADKLELAREVQLAQAQAQAAAQSALEAKNRDLSPVPTKSEIPAGNCATWLSEAGVTALTDAMYIINRESGCNPWAVNPSSGACGVAQELPCGKSGCRLGDGGCQVRWMNQYVSQRYGGWTGAVGFWRQNHWY